METYISILRGINVSGQKMIRMDKLVSAYEELGFKDVKSYIQSGNVIFNYKTSGEKVLEKKIVKKISEAFGFDVPVIVKSKSDISEIIANNPFTKNTDKDITKLHVTFLSSPPDPANIKNIKDEQYLPDQLVITDKAVYLYCPNGYGNTKLNNNFLENKLKVSATTRNWKTVNELLNISDSL